MGYLIFTYKKRKKYPDTSEYPHQTHIELKITLFLPTKTKKSIQIPRDTRTEHTSSLKLPYFYLQKPKKVSRYLGIPAPNNNNNNNNNHNNDNDKNNNNNNNNTSSNI